MGCGDVNHCTHVGKASRPDNECVPIGQTATNTIPSFQQCLRCHYASGVRPYQAVGCVTRPLEAAQRAPRQPQQPHGNLEQHQEDLTTQVRLWRGR